MGVKIDPPNPSVHVQPLSELDAANTPHVYFPLTRGPLSDNGATPWWATLGLGTPPQPLRLMLDTGTTNTWVTASCCSTAACRLHESFDPNKSTTFVAGSQPPQSVSFGPWGTMGVVLGNDVCHLTLREGEQAGTRALDEPMSIYLAVSYDGPQFAALDCDGGLAIPAKSCDQPSALLEQLRKQGLIRYAVAAFYADAARGEGNCLMGAVDPRRFDASTLNILPMQPLEGELDYLWNVRLDRLDCGGATVAQDAQLVLDTDSSRFKGGQAVIGRLLNAITGNGKRPTAVSSASALADYPNLGVTLGGVRYTLSPHQYFMQLPGPRWEVGVHHLQGLPDEFLLVGSVLLDTVYSIFYFETGQPVSGRWARQADLPRLQRQRDLAERIRLDPGNRAYRGRRLFPWQLPLAHRCHRRLSRRRRRRSTAGRR